MEGDAALCVWGGFMGVDSAQCVYVAGGMCGGPGSECVMHEAGQWYAAQFVPSLPTDTSSTLDARISGSSSCCCHAIGTSTAVGGGSQH